MDFIDGLPPSQGYTVIMVTMDHLSKYTHFINLKHSYTALIVTKVFKQRGFFQLAQKIKVFASKFGR